MKPWSRRTFLATLGIGAAQLAFGASRANSKSRRPNVILIMTDDQGATDVGCYGAADLHTPNLDALAARGVRFTQFYVASTVCSPSRGALLTGRYPERNGLNGNAGGAFGLPPGEVTIADVFKSGGYHTAAFGKWHLGMLPEMSPTARGFDEYFGHKEGCIDNYSHFFYWSGPNRHDLWRNDEMVHEDGKFFPDLMTNEALRFIEEKKDDPFFLYLPFNLPHYPMQAKQEFDALYEDKLEQPRRRYAAFVSTVDDRIGQVMNKVDALGLREDTIIVFLSDNGHSLEERAFWGGGDAGPYRGNKFNFFEGGIRMPCIVSWPGVVPENEVRAQTVTSMDWLPTLTGLCGLKPTDRKLDGYDIRDIIRDESTPSPHEIVHWQLREQWAVLKGDWKLVCNVPATKIEDRVIPKVDVWLSNLAADPGENHNLAETHPEIVSELTALHEAWLVDTARK